MCDLLVSRVLAECSLGAKRLTSTEGARRHDAGICRFLLWCRHGEQAALARIHLVGRADTIVCSDAGVAMMRRVCVALEVGWRCGVGPAGLFVGVGVVA